MLPRQVPSPAAALVFYPVSSLRRSVRLDIFLRWPSPPLPRSFSPREESGAGFRSPTEKFRSKCAPPFSPHAVVLGSSALVGTTAPAPKARAPSWYFGARCLPSPRGAWCRGLSTVLASGVPPVEIRAGCTNQLLLQPLWGAAGDLSWG